MHILQAFGRWILLILCPAGNLHYQLLNTTQLLHIVQLSAVRGMRAGVQCLGVTQEAGNRKQETAVAKLSLRTKRSWLPVGLM